MPQPQVPSGPNADLTMDIDTRMSELRAEMFEGLAICDDLVAFVAALLRAAYGKGLIDALTDPKDARAFCRRHGFKPPKAKTR